MQLQKITPNLWFDGNAKEAVEYYASIFPDGKILSTQHYPNSTEEGLADFQKDMAGKELAIEFALANFNFTAINAGPEFSFTAAASFMLNFDPSQDPNARENLDKLWSKLIDGGEAMMPLDEYPYSKRYGWVKDRYGLTWQLILTDPEGEPRPFIIPSLLFGGNNVNRAEEALNFYQGVFKNSKIGTIARYQEDTGPAKSGSIMFADFTIENQWFSAMDSGVDQDFSFNEAVSFAITCEDQAEIDYYWERLSTVPAAEQCGWCKDQFGVSWQIVPANMGELMQRPNAYANMMNMKKLVIADF